MKSTWQSWLFALLITFTLGFGSGYSLHWALSTPPAVPTAFLQGDNGAPDASANPDGKSSKDANTFAPSSSGMHLFVAIDGHWLNEDTRRLLQEVQPGGVVLRAQNVRSAAQVLNLVREIKETRTEGAHRFSDLPFIALAPDVDAAAALGVAGVDRPRLVRAAEQMGARQLGRELGLAAADRGINLLLGPILEVQMRSTEFPEIGRVAYDNDPVVVATYGVEEASGILDAGVLAAPAYFPGYASATRSGGEALPVLHQDYAGLAQRMFPFNEAVSAGVHGLVVAHVHVPTVEPGAPVRPASQSPKVLGEILRGLWGFDGVILADDITSARADLASPEAAAVASLAAGCDAVLMLDPNPERVRTVARAVATAVTSGELNAANLQMSRERFGRWQQWLDGPLSGDTTNPQAATQVARAEGNLPDPLVKQSMPLREGGGWEPADPALSPEPDYSPWPDETAPWSETAPAPTATSPAPTQEGTAVAPPNATEVASLPPATSSPELPTTTPDPPAQTHVDAGPAPAEDAPASANTDNAPAQDASANAEQSPPNDASPVAEEEQDQATVPDEKSNAADIEEGTAGTDTELQVVTHPVQPGEDLAAIATRYKVDPAALKEWNELGDAAVEVGKSIELHLAPDRAEEVLAEREQSPLVEYQTVAYKVEAGDTLTGIAVEYGVAVDDLVQWNQLSDREIQSGRTLKIYRPADAPPVVAKPPADKAAAPPAEAEQAEAARPTSPPASAVASTYTVQAGDTLTRISGLHGVTADAVMKLNNITNPNHIFVGQKLKIPK